MDSGMISKIEKAKRYAEEPERVSFQSFVVQFRGTHESHRVTYDRGAGRASCEFLRSAALCSHSMAMERLLDPMLTISLGSRVTNRWERRRSLARAAAVGMTTGPAACSGRALAGDRAAWRPDGGACDAVGGSGYRRDRPFVALERWGERFTARLYTPDEVAYCRGRVPELAAALPPRPSPKPWAPA